MRIFRAGTVSKKGKRVFLSAIALIVATPANLADALARAKSGDEIRLTSGKYKNVRLTRSYPEPLTIDASAAVIVGLVIVGDGILWKSGIISASGGRHGFAGAGYAAKVTGSNITFLGVTFTDAKKGLVLDRARGISVLESHFNALGEDGIIASQVQRLVVLGNLFNKTVGKPTSCNIAGLVVLGLSSRQCLDRFGLWQDGYHPDAIQMRNGVTNALIEGNVIEGKTQGITQMDTFGDAPLQNVVVQDNVVTADIHHITLGLNCLSCLIQGNHVRRWRGYSYRAVIRQGRAYRCGNHAQDERNDPACKKAK